MEILKDTISNVIADMYFLIEEAKPRNASDKVVYYSFVYCKEFELAMMFDEVLAKEMTLNFLGLEDDQDEDDIYDTLSDLINMIIGQYIPKVFNEFNQLLPIPKSGLVTDFDKNFDDHDIEEMYFDGKLIKICYKEF